MQRVKTKAHTDVLMAFRSLKPRLRIAIAEYFLFDEKLAPPSYSEIAERFGVKRRAICKRVNVALSLLPQNVVTSLKSRRMRLVDIYRENARLVRNEKAAKWSNRNWSIQLAQREMYVFKQDSLRRKAA